MGKIAKLLSGRQEVFKVDLRSEDLTPFSWQVILAAIAKTKGYMDYKDLHEACAERVRMEIMMPSRLLNISKRLELFIYANGSSPKEFGEIRRKEANDEDVCYVPIVRKNGLDEVLDSNQWGTFTRAYMEILETRFGIDTSKDVYDRILRKYYAVTGRKYERNMSLNDEAGLYSDVSTADGDVDPVLYIDEDTGDARLGDAFWAKMEGIHEAFKAHFAKQEGAESEDDVEQAFFNAIMRILGIVRTAKTNNASSHAERIIYFLSHTGNSKDAKLAERVSKALAKSDDKPKRQSDSAESDGDGFRPTPKKNIMADVSAITSARTAVVAAIKDATANQERDLAGKLNLAKTVLDGLLVANKDKFNVNEANEMLRQAGVLGIKVSGTPLRFYQR